jgi:hypothetical protein
MSQRTPSGLGALAHLERGLPRQTLVNNGPDAPEISLPVIVLGHDDFRGLQGQNVDQG